MPVFDFTNTPEDNNKDAVCTYATFNSNERTASADKPILVLDNKERKWKHHSSGVFTNQSKRTAFEFKEDDGNYSADILQIDSRFVCLLKWLGKNHINVRLSGANREDGYAVYKIREIALGCDSGRDAPFRLYLPGRDAGYYPAADALEHAHRLWCADGRESATSTRSCRW